MGKGPKMDETVMMEKDLAEAEALARTMAFHIASPLDFLDVCS